MSTKPPGATPPAAAQAVYASFLLGDDEFALDVRHVQEVVNLPASVTPMPLSPAFVQGVFNLRGVVVPMLSMSRLLGLDGEPMQAGSKVVIVQHRRVSLGLLFDRTNRVLRPRGEEQTLFGYEDRSTHRVVAGVLKIADDLIRVLDLDRLVGIENVPHARGTAHAADAARAKRAHKRCITFRVGKLLLGFAINGVHEIVPAQGIERSPVQDALCAGVMHIRDDIVPVVRLKDLLKADADPATDLAGEQRVIVLKIGQMHAGLLVDAVEAITAYAEEDVMHVPLLTPDRASMFAGCIDLGERGHVFLLDCQRVLDDGEVGRITGQHSGLFAGKTSHAETRRLQASARQTFLWFDARQAFALPMRDVREIIDCAEGLIAMPSAPDFVPGMYNLRGKLVTVVDVRKFYQWDEAAEATAAEPLERKVLVLQVGDTLLGLQVDKVRSIVNVNESDKYPIPLIMRNMLPAAVRHDVTQIVQAHDERNEITHLLLLDVARMFASIGQREADTVDA